MRFGELTPGVPTLSVSWESLSCTVFNAVKSKQLLRSSVLSVRGLGTDGRLRQWQSSWQWVSLPSKGAESPARTPRCGHSLSSSFPLYCSLSLKTELGESLGSRLALYSARLTLIESECIYLSSSLRRCGTRLQEGALLPGRGKGTRGGLFQGTGEKMKYNPGTPALSNPWVWRLIRRQDNAQLFSHEILKPWKFIKVVIAPCAILMIAR